MKRLTACIILLVVCASLLAACSLGAEETTEPRPRASNPTARPVAIEAGASIDGRLLFVQDGNLYLHQGDRTRQITKDGTTRDPVWSPDGQRIAFVRREESYSDIYLLNANGGLPTQITFNRGQSNPRSQEFMHEVVWATSPTWTPDSSAVVFLSQVAPPSADPLAEYPLSIYRYRLSLVGQRQPTNDDLLVRAENADFQRPAWAPDDSLLAFVRVPRENAPKQIMTFDPANEAVQPYPGIPDNAYDPAWSPDSRWLAFAAQIGGRTDIWALPHPALGGSAVRLTNTGAARSPTWSPDGTRIAYTQVGDAGTDLYVLSVQIKDGALTGGEPKALTSNGQIDASSGLSWGR